MITDIHNETKKDRATAHYRKGELGAARTLLLEALSETSDTDERLALTNNLAIVERADGNVRHAYSILLLSAPLKTESKDDLLIANYHNTLAITYKQLAVEEGITEYFDKALIEYEAARFHYEQAGNDRFLGGVRNNIASLLISINRPEEALEHLEGARKHFADLGEKARVAEVDDTRALALLKLGRKRESWKVISESIYALIGTEEKLALEKSRATADRILDEVLS